MATISLRLTDEQRALEKGVTEICKRYPGEYWRELDARREYPEKFVDELTQAGYLAALIPQEYGGAGLPIRDGARIGVVRERLEAGQQVLAHRGVHRVVLLRAVQHDGDDVAVVRAGHEQMAIHHCTTACVWRLRTSSSV